MTAAPSIARRTAVAHAVHSVLLAMLATAPLLTPAVASADATSTARNVDIPAGPLGATISRYASTAGVAIAFDATQLAGLSSPGLHGNYTVDQAYAQLLQGSGWEAEQLGDGNYVLRKAAAAPQATEISMREIRVTGRRDGETEGTASYTTPVITIGKTAQSLREHPQTVSVLTRQRLDDQHISDLSKAAEQAVGITVQDNTFLIQKLYARGFEISSYQLDGGAPMDTGFSASIAADLAEYDRVEILRGAAGLLNGTGNPGGAVNLVRKMPTAAPQFNASVAAGSWNNYRSDLDASGPLAFDGKLRGRVVVAYENRKYFTAIRATEKPLIYGVLEADIAPGAVLAIGAREQRTHDRGTWPGLPRYSTGAELHLPRNTGAMADWAGVDSTSRELFAKLTWRLAQRWTLRANAAQMRQAGATDDGFILGAIDPQTLTGGRWQSGHTQYHNKQQLLDINVSGAFDWFGRTHEVLAGIDGQKVTSSWVASYPLEGNGTPGDLFHPGNTPFPKPVYGPVERDYDPWGQTQYGAYATLRLDVAEGSKLIAGARVNRYRYRQHYRELDTDTGIWDTSGLTQYAEPTKVTPFIGFMHDINHEWSAYASHAQIFKPQADFKAGPAPGTGLRPMRGANSELGLKGELLGGKLNTALALYRIVQDGRAVNDPRYEEQSALFSSNCCYLASGKVVSQGVEMEVNGEVAAGVQLSGGYTYNHNSNETEKAVFSTITPRHALKLWGSWQLPGEASAWKLGAGATMQSKQYAQGTAASWNAATGKFNGPAVPFNYTQASYAVWNAMAQYRIDRHWSASVNINNVFDKTYYRTMGRSSNGNFYGEPRSAALILRASY